MSTARITLINNVLTFTDDAQHSAYDDYDKEEMWIRKYEQLPWLSAEVENYRYTRNPRPLIYSALHGSYTFPAYDRISFPGPILFQPGTFTRTALSL